MKKLMTFLVVGAMSMLIGCSSSMDIVYDYDKAMDFGKYKTYAWLLDNAFLDVEDGLTILELPGDLIMAQVDAGFREKGLSLDYETPQFLVLVHFGLKEKVTVTDKGGSDYGVGKLKVEVESHPEGTVFLDIIDTELLDLVWRGTGTKETDDNPTEESVKKNIQKVLSKLIDGFPPPKS